MIDVLRRPQLTGLLPVVAALLALFVYGLLPLLGIEQLAQALSMEKLLKLVLLGVGAVGYGLYVRWILKHPYMLLTFVLLGWPLLEYASQILMEMGLNLRMRPLMLATVGLPSLIFMVQYGRAMMATLPFVGVFTGFLTLVTLYFVFFNANAADPKLGADFVWSEGSISFGQLISYLFIGCGIVTGSIGLLHHREPARLFDRLNMGLMGISSVLAIITILGYPFGLFCQNVDGFVRANGIYTHPNPYAHHMGLLMLYLLGMFCYYQGRNRLPQWLLLLALGTNGLAFLLGLSKTAIAGVGLFGLLLMGLNLSSERLRKQFVRLAVVVVLMIPVGLVGFQAATGKTLLDVMEARMEENTSMVWREEAWGRLMAQMDAPTLMVGHGFTAANVTLFGLSYNTEKNATPLILVHNGYISLLYDFGLPGMLLFVAVGMLIWQAIGLFPGSKPLMATVMALSGYFLFASGFDEMIYMFDAPLFFWTTATMLVCMALWGQRRGDELA
jgi:O-antigen ligase